MGKESFNSLTLRENLIIKQNPFGDLKIFYLYDESDIPFQLRGLINPKRTVYEL